MVVVVEAVVGLPAPRVIAVDTVAITMAARHAAWALERPPRRAVRAAYRRPSRASSFPRSRSCRPRRTPLGDSSVWERHPSHGRPAAFRRDLATGGRGAPGSRDTR